MGASIDYRSYKYDKMTDEKWNSDVEESGYQDGHEYSGCIAMLGSGYDLDKNIFKSFDDAIEHLENTHSKWDGALGVRYTDGKPDKVYQSRIKNHNTIIDNLVNNRAILGSKLVAMIKSRKAKLITCLQCESKVNKNYLVTHNSHLICPCCKSSVHSITDHNRMQRADNKIKLAQQKLKAIKPKVTDKGINCIVIGGWCSC